MAQAELDQNFTRSLLVYDPDADTTLLVTGKDLTNSNPIHVAIVDGSGDQITSFGGGTQYTEDNAAAANPVGNANILIRTDTPATQVTTDGDNVAQRGTNYGAAYVQLVTSAGAYIDSVGGGTQYAVDDALGATPTGTLAVAIRDDALAALTPVEGDAIGLRVDANGALWTHDDVLDTVFGTASVLSAGSIKVVEQGTVSVSYGSGTFAVSNAGLTALNGAISGTEVQVDVVGALPAGTNAIGKVGHDITGIGHGVKTITSAGTDEALAGSTACKRVIIQAQTDNTGFIAVGATGVDATEATGTGVILYAGDSVEMDIDNLADIFIDATVNGEGVRYTYFT